MEIVDDCDGNTYRAVYTTKLGGVVYVLHVFREKSTHGIATPRHEIDPIVQRLEWARQHHAAHYAATKRDQEGAVTMAEHIRVTKSSGNVFADLGLPNPEERLAKATLARKGPDHQLASLHRALRHPSRRQTLS